MESNIWHDSFAASFSRKKGYFISKSCLINQCGSVELLISIHCARGKKRQFAFLVSVAWSVLHVEPKELIRPHASAFYHIELLGNPLSSFYDTIYDRMWGKLRVRGQTVGLILTESLLCWPVLWLHVSGVQLRDNAKHMAISFLIQEQLTQLQLSYFLYTH